MSKKTDINEEVHVQAAEDQPATTAPEGTAKATTQAGAKALATVSDISMSEDPQPAKPETIILTANSREEIAQKFDEMKAAYPGATIMAGAVGYNYEKGTYSLRFDLVNQ